jgi:hypothetical protein
VSERTVTDESKFETSREAREAAAGRASIAVRPDAFQHRQRGAAPENVFALKGVDVH